PAALPISTSSRCTTRPRTCGLPVRSCRPAAAPWAGACTTITCSWPAANIRTAPCSRPTARLRPMTRRSIAGTCCPRCAIRATAMDTIPRLYGDQLSQSLGKPIVVDNRPGAAMMLAMTSLARAPADGYTLGIATSGPLATNPVLYKKIDYDPDKDFSPIALYVKSPFVLVVNPALPARTVPELIKLARAS